MSLLFPLLMMAITIYAIFRLASHRFRHHKFMRGLEVCKVLSRQGRNTEGLVVLQLTVLLYHSGVPSDLLPPDYMKNHMNYFVLLLQEAQEKKIDLTSVVVEYCRVVTKRSPKKLPKVIQALIWPSKVHST